MTTGTTLVAFKGALRTRLAARAGLTGVQVLYAKPTSGLKAEAIWFEDAETDAEIPVLKAGTKKVDEHISLVAVIQVRINDGRNEEAADLRAAELLAELQQELAETPRTIDAIQWAEMLGWSHTVGPIGDGTSRAARFEVTLRIRARLG